MFEDLQKEIKSHLYDRVRSPLTGGFIVSWCIWNWRIIFTLFSDLAYTAKIAELNCLIDNSGSWHLKLWLFPLITALLYIFVYPYLAKFPYEFSETRKKELKEIKRGIEDETPITQEEANRLRRVNQQQLLKIQQEMGEIQARYQVALAKIAELEGKEQSFKKTNLTEKEAIQTVLSASEDKKMAKLIQSMQPKILMKLKKLTGIAEDRVLNVYLALVKVGGSQSSSNLAQRTDINRVEISHSLDVLQKAGVVDTYSGGYELTARGQKIAFELELTNL